MLGMSLECGREEGGGESGGSGWRDWRAARNNLAESNSRVWVWVWDSMIE